jgi:hypothetical protein
MLMKLKKWLLAGLAAAMMFGIMPMSAAAAEEEEPSFAEYIAEQFKEFKSQINVEAYADKNGWDMNETLKEVLHIILENGELFFLDSSKGIGISSNGRTTVLTDIPYTIKKSQYKSAKKNFDTAVDAALDCLDESMTKTDQALALHDYLILNVEYDDEFKNYDAYDALVSRKAVCQGYSTAYDYLLEQIGIESRIVQSESMNHAWNLIKLGSSWYHVDVTYDDPTPDRFGKVSHRYFLLSDKGMKADKHYDWAVYGETTPKASKTNFDSIFWRDDMKFSSAFVYADEYWYYTETGDGSYANIKRFKFGAGTQQVAKIDTMWTTDGGNSYYTSVAPSLALYDGKLYYNTAEAIYTISTGGKNAKKIFSPSAVDKKNDILVYGFRIRNDKLQFVTASSPQMASASIKQFSV